MKKNEVAIFCHYLIGKEPNIQTRELYLRAETILEEEVSQNQSKLIDAILRSPWKLPYYDAALALINPHHLLRIKLHRMFAILETQPDFAALFLGKSFGIWHFIKIILVGIRAVFRTFIGLIILPRSMA
jgi:hypothetical protein